MSKALSIEEIKSVLANPQGTSAGEPKTRWPSLEDKALIVKAVSKANKSHKETFPVTLSDMREFIVHVNPANKDLVYVRLNDKHSYAPCGWFKISTMKSEITEEEALHI